MRQPEAFRAVTRFSPPPPAGGAPSQRGPGNYERSRRHAQALPQAARGYRLLPLCSPHGAARAPAPPCAGAARCGPGGAGPGRRAAGATDGFPRRAAGRPRGGAPPPRGPRPPRPPPPGPAAPRRGPGRPWRPPARPPQRPYPPPQRSRPCPRGVWGAGRPGPGRRACGSAGGCPAAAAGPPRRRPPPPGRSRPCPPPPM